MARLRLFKVECPLAQTRYYHSRSGAVRRANTLANDEGFTVASEAAHYLDGVALLRRDMDRPWTWVGQDPSTWLQEPQ